MKSNIIKQDIKEIQDEFDKDLQTLRGKNILITGGNGSIASYLVDTFVDYDCNLTILNRNKVTNFSRLSHLLDNPKVKFLSQDVGKPFIPPQDTNIIIHAASRSNPKSFLENPLDTIDSNVNGTRTLLEHAKKNSYDLDNFLYFSSAEIYGNPVKEFVPTPEHYTGNIDCLHPMSCYMESKRFSEMLCSTFFRQHDIPTKMLRILLSYGPGMRDDGKVVSDFYTSAKNNQEIKIRDKGDATRSFCYITDTTKGILKVMFDGKSGEAYNIGNDLEKVSILKLAEKVAGVVNNNTIVKPNLKAISKPMYGEPTRDVNIDKLRALEYKPKVSLEEGLRRLDKHIEEVGW